jgi:CRP/FNR family cyclic AMP-dependent transcriptional regulator
MKPKKKQLFDTTFFLSKIGKGRTINDYEKNRMIFTQGNAADALFYIQKGKVKLTVVSPQGKEAVVAILGTTDFFGEGCLAGRGAWQPLRLCPSAPSCVSKSNI